MPEKALYEELYASKSALEDNLGLKVPGLAYPFGYSNAKVRQLARDLGYDYAYAVGNALSDQRGGPVRHSRGSPCGGRPRWTNSSKMVNGQDTLTLRRDRVLTSGYSVVRRARSALRARRGQA